MNRDAIATDKLAAPVGPFSLGVRGAGLLFLSGQVAQDPANGRLIEGDVARQTHQILDNIATALEVVGKFPVRCAPSGRVLE
jgi:2-iminobutanoate/2-iminopropanoate deaminase